jgi:hypothetical protein
MAVMKIKEHQKGVALYISLIIMAILLAIGLGITIIIIGETKIMRNIGDSVIAFQAADTGIENALYNMRHLDPPDNTSNIGLTAMGDSSYFVEYIPGPSLESWRSVGDYKGEERAIQIDQQIAFDFDFQAVETDFCLQTPAGSAGTTVHAVYFSGGEQSVMFVAENTPPPPGVGVDFVPNAGILSSTAPNFDSDLTITTDGTTPLGLYNFSVMADIADTAVKDISIPMTLVIQDEFTPCP